MFLIIALQHHVVWLDCYGVTPADKEFIGPLNYYPRRGFNGVYFPFTGVESDDASYLFVKNTANSLNEEFSTA
jgi:hypothetical protein